MGLKHLMLELDTSVNGIYKVLDDASLLRRVEEYAADSVLHGCYQARALLFKVYGKDMNLLRADPSGLEGRPPRQENGDVEITALKGHEASTSDRFEVYPNPAANSFFLFYDGKPDVNASLMLSDMLGRKIMEGAISQSERIELSTNSLNNGIFCNFI